MQTLPDEARPDVSNRQGKQTPRAEVTTYCDPLRIDFAWSIETYLALPAFTSASHGWLLACFQETARTAWTVDGGS